MMSPRWSLKPKGKNIKTFLLQHKIELFTFELELKDSKCEFFAFWNRQYNTNSRLLNFLKLRSIIKFQTIKIDLDDVFFKVIIASGGYHVDIFVGWKTVGHIPREISRYVYFFIKEKSGKVFGTLKSLKYKASPIASGALEVPLSLRFSSKKKWVVDTMEQFIQNFYPVSQVTLAIASTRKRMIIKLSLLNQKRRKMRRGKKSIRQSRFTNRQEHTCSYYNKLINSIFTVLF